MAWLHISVDALLAFERQESPGHLLRACTALAQIPSCLVGARGPSGYPHALSTITSMRRCHEGGTSEREHVFVNPQIHQA